LPAPLELIIDGGYVNDPCTDEPHSEGFSSDEYCFQYDKDSNRLILQDKRTSAGVLDALAQVWTFEGLPSVLREFSSNVWLWVNFHIGIRFRFQDEALSEPGIVWTASDFWSNFLYHLSPWLI
jgi:hypothetical protein